MDFEYLEKHYVMPETEESIIVRQVSSHSKTETSAIAESFFEILILIIPPCFYKNARRPGRRSNEHSDNLYSSCFYSCFADRSRYEKNTEILHDQNLQKMQQTCKCIFVEEERRSTLFKNS